MFVILGPKGRMQVCRMYINSDRSVRWVTSMLPGLAAAAAAEFAPALLLLPFVASCSDKECDDFREDMMRFDERVVGGKGDQCMLSC